MKKFRLLDLFKRLVPSRFKYRAYRLLVPLSADIELKSFSQAGEDTIVRSLLKSYPIGLHELLYLDIGARHPEFGNNTFLFYCYGSRGVCIDADETYIGLLNKNRPRDIILNVGIAPNASNIGDLYFMEGGG